MLQNPIMYDMWGGTSNIFSARSLRSKIPRSQGVRSPDPLTRVYLGRIKFFVYPSGSVGTQSHDKFTDDPSSHGLEAIKVIPPTLCYEWRAGS